MRITTKRQMYEMLIAGKFGNTIRMWRSAAEMIDSGYQGIIMIRSLSVGDPLRIYSDPVWEALKKLDDLGGTHRTDLIFGAAPPDDHRLIQGELCRSPWGMYFRYNRLDMPMRTAFEQENLHAWGLEVMMLLRANVDPSSLDDLFEVLDKYDGCVIEFSAYSIGVGSNPSRKIIVWEVRHY